MTDVNDLVEAEWVEEATPYKRVREVMKHSYEPRSVDDIADTACTTSEETRAHLRDLEAEGFVDECDEAWKRNEESLVAEQAADLRERLDREEIAEAVAEMEAEDEPDETTRRNLRFARTALREEDGA